MLATLREKKKIYKVAGPKLLKIKPKTKIGYHINEGDNW